MSRRLTIQFAAELAREHGLTASITDLADSPYPVIYTRAGQVSTAEVLAALRRWQPRRRRLADPTVVYHGTDRRTADRMIADGISSVTKSVTLARANYRARRYAIFQPGAGLGAGLYVSNSKDGASHYGRIVLRLRVSRRALRIPPEVVGCASSVAQALGSHDGAMLLGTVHSDDVSEAR